LSDRARPIDIGFLGDDDLLVLTPEPGLPGGAAAAETRADDQDIDIVFDDRFLCHQ